jgi:methylmalonyl-CoA mutase
MGPPTQHKARADFSSGFFATGGFEAIGKQNFETAGSAALAAVASGARIAVLCSTDETYPALAPAFAHAVKAAAPGMILVLAGYPTDVHGVLEKLLKQIDTGLSNA